MPDLGPCKDYKGPAGALRDSPWLTADMLPRDRGVVVTIERVVQFESVEFVNEGRREEKVGYGALYFVEGKTKKPLGLCATNNKILQTLFGPTTGDWWGKRIELFVDILPKSFGKKNVPAVRIRAKHVDQPNQPATQKRDEPVWRQLIDPETGQDIPPAPPEGDENF
jgi:hypothetical protein